MANNELFNFLITLKDGDNVSFILSSGMIRGKFKNYNQNSQMVVISECKGEGANLIAIGTELHIPMDIILVWGILK